jgi:ELWxxDGT repeat protein
MKTKPTEFLFIDANVADKQTLLAGIAANVTVVELNDNTDALTQIASALNGYTNLDAIHIISHGSEGELDFASGAINSANLSTYQAQLKKIGASLSKDGDLLLYGCEVAKGDDGQAFITSLAEATKADVAASIDFTGAASLGGNWVLETNAGAIEVAGVNAPNYNHLLTAAAVAFQTTGSTPISLTYVNGTLYFSADDGVNGKELWKSDGTTTGTVMVKDISTSISYLASLTNVNGTLYFSANDGVNGQELWKSDGTTTGTVMVKDIRTGTSGSTPSLLTKDIVKNNIPN